MALKVYNPGDVSLVFFGIPISTGFGDGTFVTIEQNEDSFSLQVGTDGEATRSQSNNRSGRVTFTLMQSSDANDALSAVHNADITTGDGVGALLVKDNSGRTLVSAEKAWIVKPPSAEFAREATSREWVVETDQLIQFFGGN